MSGSAELLPAPTTIVGNGNPNNDGALNNGLQVAKKRPLSVEPLEESTVDLQTQDVRSKRARTGSPSNGLNHGQGQSQPDIKGAIHAMGSGEADNMDKASLNSGSEEGEVFEAEALSGNIGEDPDDSESESDQRGGEEAGEDDEDGDEENGDENERVGEEEDGEEEDEDDSEEGEEASDGGVEEGCGNLDSKRIAGEPARSLQGSSRSDSEDEEGAARSISQSPSSESSNSPPQASGWNRGITSGQVRISLGLGTKPAPVAPVVKGITSTDIQNGAIPPQPLHTQQPYDCILPKSKVSLQLPILDDRKRHDSWKVRFEAWAAALADLNAEKAPFSDQITLEAYNFYIDRVSGIHSKKKRPAKEAAKAVLQSTKSNPPLNGVAGVSTIVSPNSSNITQNGTMPPKITQGKPVSGEQHQAQGLLTAADWARALDGGDSQPSSANISSKAAAPPPPAPCTLAELRSSVPSGSEESKQKMRYFPGLRPTTDACVLCLQLGHKADGCQANLCTECEDPEKHLSYVCPRKQRCTRCRMTGHGADNCSEDKPNSHRDQDIRCVHCESPNHRDERCDTLWRTFDYGNLDKKVGSILAFCSLCGEEGHYISDCSRNGALYETKTWRLETLEKCVDKTSRQGPISEFKSVTLAAAPRAPYEMRRPELVGKTFNNISFDSDDSDEANFLADRVQPKKPLGRIDLSTNIQFADASNPAPISPAPRPPQGPAAGGRPSDSRRSMHPLPPRPQVPAAPPRRGGFHNVPPPPGLHRNETQGSNGRNSSNGGSSRGSRDKGSRRGGRRGGGFRGSRGGSGGWA